MNLITLSIIIIVAVIGLGYMIIKNHHINTLAKKMKQKEYETVIILVQQPSYCKFLGKFNSDLFLMRAYYLLNDMEMLRNKAVEMLHETYTKIQEKQFLELYYHIFLNKHDVEMTDKFLEQISRTNDRAFVKYNQYAYDVIINKRDDLIATMETEIEAKLYTGFALGTIVYLIALQYFNKEDYANATAYFEECILCFHPTAFYIDKANAYIKKLKEMSL